MAGKNLADAKARFSELVCQAAAGEIFQTIERESSVAELAGATAARRSVDLIALRS